MYTIFYGIFYAGNSHFYLLYSGGDTYIYSSWSFPNLSISRVTSLYVFLIFLLPFLFLDYFVQFLHMLHCILPYFYLFIPYRLFYSLFVCVFLYFFKGVISILPHGLYYLDEMRFKSLSYFSVMYPGLLWWENCVVMVANCIHFCCLWPCACLWPCGYRWCQMAWVSLTRAGLLGGR